MANDPPSQPSLTSGITGGIDKATAWMSDHWIWIALLVIGFVLLLIFLSIRHADAKKRLQRDALERLRKNVIHACRTNRARGIRTVWTTGSPSQPPVRLGKYKGHTRHLEAVWITYKPGLFQRVEALWANPVDVPTAYDGPELHVRALGVWHARDFSYAIPDAHDARERREWAKTTTAAVGSAQEFVEAVKRYYARAIDNAVAFFDALNAVEDRSYLRQEVTRGENEQTETLSVPAAAEDASPEAGAPRST
ncbi:MAG: hypothetical protein QOE90_1525 [Thermoplasmata archaeon]|jgi:hypothetical protein|nr:hypothetical protein [Thermoplasmata archaeon]